jgi:hypothetical protein
MSEKFPEAFTRFIEQKGTANNFQELLDSFEGWNVKTQITKKQKRALAIEARKIGINDTYEKSSYQDKKGNWMNRMRDIISGRFVKSR